MTTEFSVDPSAPIEQVELSAETGLPSRLASLSRGVVVAPHEAHRLFDVLKKPKPTETQRRQYSLWDSWPLLILMVLIATAEWLLRKKAGLA